MKPPQVLRHLGQPTAHRSLIFIVSGRRQGRHERLLLDLILPKSLYVERRARFAHSHSSLPYFSPTTLRNKASSVLNCRPSHSSFPPLASRPISPRHAMRPELIIATSSHKRSTVSST